MLLVTVDPLTGDRTCQTASATIDDHPIVLSGDLNQPRKAFYAGFGVIVTILVLGTILTGCCTLHFLRKPDSSYINNYTNKPVSGLFKLAINASRVFKWQDRAKRSTSLQSQEREVPHGYVNRFYMSLHEQADNVDAGLCRCTLFSDDKSIEPDAREQHGRLSTQTGMAFRVCSHCNPVSFFLNGIIIVISRQNCA